MHERKPGISSIRGIQPRGQITKKDEARNSVKQWFDLGTELSLPKNVIWPQAWMLFFGQETFYGTKTWMQNVYVFNILVMLIQSITTKWENVYILHFVSNNLEFTTKTNYLMLKLSFLPGIFFQRLQLQIPENWRKTKLGSRNPRQCTLEVWLKYCPFSSQHISLLCNRIQNGTDLLDIFVREYQVFFLFSSRDCNF